MNYIQAEYLFGKDEIDKALEVLNSLIANNPSDMQALLLRGRIYYKMQRWGDATNDYNAVLDMDSSNLEAKSGVEMTKNILGYFTHEMFNP